MTEFAAGFSVRAAFSPPLHTRTGRPRCFAESGFSIHSLAVPHPPPPPNVPALPEAGEGHKVLSVRERLSEHRANPACATCHVRMDPLGFALENFDATGRWRTVEANGPADLNPHPIDAGGELPDGTKFDGVTGLRRILNERSDQFVYTMTERSCSPSHSAEARTGTTHRSSAKLCAPRRKTTTTSTPWSPASCPAGLSRCACRNCPGMRRCL